MRTEGLRLGGTLLLAASLTGCYSVTYDASTLPPNGASLTSIPKSRHVRHFRVERKGVWFLGGLMPIASVSLSEVLMREGEGRPVQNVRVRQEISLLDGMATVAAAAALTFGTNYLFPPGRAGTSAGNTMFLNMLLASMLTPNFRTMTIDGDIVELAEGASEEAGR